VVEVDGLAFVQPGPGPWEADLLHGPEPDTRAMLVVAERSFEAGFRAAFADHGLPLAGLALADVHGYRYVTPVLAGVPAGDRPPPPPGVLRVLVRLHPVLVRRAWIARGALRRRRWVEDNRRWHAQERASWVSRLQAVQAVRPDVLDDAALAEHVRTTEATFVHGLRTHFSGTAAVTLPIGLLVAHVRAHGGDEGSVLRAADGGVDHGGMGAARRAVADACRQADVRPASLDEVRTASPLAAQALEDLLEEHGQRLVSSFDLTGARLVELPDLLLQAIQDEVDRPTPVPVPPDPPADLGEEGLRLVAEAREGTRVRNDRAGVVAVWPAGLHRRALLEAGERLVRSGALHDAGHVFELAGHEVAGLLTGASTPSLDEVAARHAARRRAGDVAPPATLGPQHPPPDPAVFPRSMATLTRALLLAQELSERRRTGPEGERAHPGARGGTGVGTTLVRARAVVADDPSDALRRLRRGDVLVTRTTTPAYDAVLSLVGGLVTEQGGLVSHAGITARALGIPALLGVREAGRTIPDGATVELDPMAETVTVVA
jgi:pyruvate,water dikinase